MDALPVWSPGRNKVYHPNTRIILSLTTAVALLLSTSLAPSNTTLAYQNAPVSIVEAASTTATPAQTSTVANLASSSQDASSSLVGDADLAASTTDPINVKSYVEQYFADTPILAKIAGCESHFRQFAKDGSVLRGVQVHQDVGVMQINETYQGALASALGYNIYTLQGNVAFGQWLYNHEGAQPWISSSACWSQ